MLSCASKCGLAAKASLLSTGGNHRPEVESLFLLIPLIVARECLNPHMEAQWKASSSRKVSDREAANFLRKFISTSLPSPTASANSASMRTRKGIASDLRTIYSSVSRSSTAVIRFSSATASASASASASTLTPAPFNAVGDGDSYHRF